MNHALILKNAMIQNYFGLRTVNNFLRLQLNACYVLSCGNLVRILSTNGKTKTMLKFKSGSGIKNAKNKNFFGTNGLMINFRTGKKIHHLEVYWLAKKKFINHF